MSDFLDRVRADLDAATPGPWRAVLFDGVDYDDGSSSYRGGIYPAHAGAPPIILTNSVDRQNANLIASAPDRLDRMERALRCVLDLAEAVNAAAIIPTSAPIMNAGYRAALGDVVTAIKEELGDE